MSLPPDPWRYLRLEIAGEPIRAGDRVAYRPDDRHVYRDLFPRRPPGEGVGVALDAALRGETLRVEYPKGQEPR